MECSFVELSSCQDPATSPSASAGAFVSARSLYLATRIPPHLRPHSLPFCVRISHESEAAARDCWATISRRSRRPRAAPTRQLQEAPAPRKRNQEQPGTAAASSLSLCCCPAVLMSGRSCRPSTDRCALRADRRSAFSLSFPLGGLGRLHLVRLARPLSWRPRLTSSFDFEQAATWRLRVQVPKGNGTLTVLQLDWPARLLVLQRSWESSLPGRVQFAHSAATPPQINSSVRPRPSGPLESSQLAANASWRRATIAGWPPTLSDVRVCSANSIDLFGLRAASCFSRVHKWPRNEHGAALRCAQWAANELERVGSSSH